MAYHEKDKLPENCINQVASTMSKGNFCKPHILQFMEQIWHLEKKLNYTKC